MIKFNLKDGSVREFSSMSHGDAYAQDAAAFEAESKADIALRTDYEVEEAVEAVVVPVGAETPADAPVEPAPETTPEVAPEAAPIDTANDPVAPVEPSTTPEVVEPAPVV